MNFSPVMISAEGLIGLISLLAQCLKIMEKELAQICNHLPLIQPQRNCAGMTSNAVPRRRDVTAAELRWQCQQQPPCSHAVRTLSNIHSGCVSHYFFSAMTEHRILAGLSSQPATYIQLSVTEYVIMTGEE